MNIETVNITFVCIVLAAFAFGLRAGICILILIRPLCDRLFELTKFDVGGATVTYGAVINIIVLCVTIINFAKIRRCTPPKLRSIWVPFLFVCAVATLYSPVQIDALRKLLAYVSFYSMFVLSFAVVKSERDVLFFLKWVILSSVLPVLYGIFEILSGVDWYEDFRIQSTFPHPNVLAFYVTAVVGVILFLNATECFRISGRLRLLFNLYLIPLIIVLIMTKTRSAWAGCFVLFFVYGVACDRRTLVVLLMGIVVALAVPAIKNRILNLETGNEYIGGPAVILNSYAWRELLWENSLSYISRRPILGYGLDSFNFYSPRFFIDAGGVYAHNVYIQFLFETGLIGLVALLRIFWRSFDWLIRAWRFDKRGVTMAAGITAAYMMCCYSDNIFEYLSFDWCFWFTNGLIFALVGYGAYGMRAQCTVGAPIKGEGGHPARGAA
jgi:O-antigen ligase